MIYYQLWIIYLIVFQVPTHVKNEIKIKQSNKLKKLH